MPLPTPGQYLQHARVAAGLGLEDLALATDSEPHVSAHRRAEWLRDIEADVDPVPPGLVASIGRFLPALDPDMLDQLIAAHTNAAVWREAGTRVLSPRTVPKPQSAAA